MRPNHLASIDVLRGAAASSVVLYHAIGRDLWYGAAQSPGFALLGFPAAFGFSGVFLFFTISGFCIHLSWARQMSLAGAAKTDFVAFWKKRFRRLYPAYLAALCLYLVMLRAEGAPASGVRPIWWDVGLHLLMLHNLDPATSLSIDGIFWTLAVEEQLYLAYFLLLALRQSFGWSVTLTVCLAARVGWFLIAFVTHRLLGVDIVVQEASAAHWLVWALGAWSVEAWFGLVPRPVWVGSLWLSGVSLLGAAGLSVVGRALPANSWVQNVLWLVTDPLWGVGFFGLLNRVTASEFGGRRTDLGAPRWLSSGVAVLLGRIGLCSYSLYLTHGLVLPKVDRFLSPWLNLDEPTGGILRLLVIFPTTVAFAWLFFLLFERPFLSRFGGR